MAPRFQFERRPSDNPWLDLARALAIVLVLLRHGQRTIDPQFERTPEFIGRIFMNGWIGVDLFFVLSGFLICSHVIRNNSAVGNFNVPRYFASRALRIMPAYFAVLLAVAAGGFPFYAFPKEALVARVFQHLLFLNDYLDSTINVVFWSLAVEEKFYVAAPVVTWLCISRGKFTHAMLILAGIAFLSFVLRSRTYLLLPEPVPYEQFTAYLRQPFHACFEPLAAGMAIAVARHAGRIGENAWSGRLFMLTAVAALIALITPIELAGKIGWVNVAIYPPLLACIFGVFVLGAVKSSTASLPFEYPVRVLARLSYALYFVHLPLIPLAGVLTASSDGSLTLLWFYYVSLSMAAALLLHFAVEKPFLLWKARIDGSGVNARDNQVDPELKHASVAKA